MVWQTINAVYGYVVELDQFENYDSDDDDNYIDSELINKLLPDFDQYVSKDGYCSDDLLHTFKCCSDSHYKLVIIGVAYDEVDRNLFLDKKFDDICEKVFNVPTKIDDIDDEFFQHDSKKYKSSRDKSLMSCTEYYEKFFIKNYNTPRSEELLAGINTLVHGHYTSAVRSKPTKRKSQLLSVPDSIKTFVKSLSKKYDFFEEANCYLMMDDCTFCT